MKNILKNLVLISLLISLGIVPAKPQNQAANQRAKRGDPIRTMDIDSMRMSDPFILADPQSKTYYMTGTGGQLWKSTDLKMWKGPYKVVDIDTNSWMGPYPMIWAAELHYYNGRYYYLATFTNPKIIIEKIPSRYDIPRRASHILVSDSPEGPYKPISDNIYTPENQATLDGTLWVENGVPYFIYCHEWLQIVDGTIDMVKLSPDLGKTIGKPSTLFKASDGPWSREMLSIGELTYGKKLGGQVTDGCFLFKTKTGKLGILWSSWGDKRYAQGVAYSASGKLKGPWIHEEKPLNDDNSGHGMLFRTFDGKLLMCLHNQKLGKANAPRKPILLEVDDSGDKIKILGQFRP